MYGYLRLFKSPNHENKIFKAQYCSVCKTIQNEYGWVLRIGISFEIVFFALVCSALKSNRFEYTDQTCIVHPFRKRMVKIPSEVERVCAHINMAFLKGKFADDVQDKESLARIKRGLLKFFFKTEPPLLSEAFSIVERGLVRMNDLEKAKLPEFDAYSRCFGDVLQEIFLWACVKNRISPSDEMVQFSNLLGRWIYFIDAMDDLKKDYQKHHFNPLIYRYRDTFLTAVPLQEKLLRVVEEEKKRAQLLLEHIASCYFRFRKVLGIYSMEIDDIILHNLPLITRNIASQYKKKELQ